MAKRLITGLFIALAGLLRVHFLAEQEICKGESRLHSLHKCSM